jgi:DNA mismatch repair protein MutS
VTAKATPVMKQHAAAKAAHPDCIVFFRLGDFYEMFGEDAVLVSRALDLTLTSRNKGKPDEIPMAGVPHHAAHGYIARLLSQGHKVAICEQMADPATVKGIVPREVVRVVTPGTWNADGQLEPGTNNWLCAIEMDETGVGVALLDLSTAELAAAVVADVAALLSEVGRTAPKEILLGNSHDYPDVAATLREVAQGATVREAGAVQPSEVQAALTGIDIGGASSLAARASARALLFARECFRDKSFPVWRVALWNPTGVLQLDRVAQRHLELTESTVGDSSATLLRVIDRTRSPGGARLLRRRIMAPLTDVPAIRRRQDQVEAFVQNPEVREVVQKALGHLGDLERLAVRGTLGEATPRDLGNVRRGLACAEEAVRALMTLPDKAARDSLVGSEEFDLVADLKDVLDRALVERPPVQVKEGAVFSEGFDPELDELQKLRHSGSERMTELEQELKVATQIPTLRVKFTRVFGWYVEVSRGYASKVPTAWRRKQTVAGGERFTLERLDQLSDNLTSADMKFRARELELLDDLSAQLSAAAPRVHKLTAQLSAIDVAASLAQVACEYDYCRPVVDEGDALRIVDGRHPVVERLAALGRFVPNDVELESRGVHLWLISGPNMAGKSTFLRQVALAVVLAQMGAYVPARSAHIGIVDRLLSRVGASDNLAGGESTFMVEMRETANILRSATSRSFVILDEIGRGTSTFDGLAIAWAVAEHLDEVVKCRALFATHYHELTEFAEKSATAANRCVSAREHAGDIVFLHRVTEGAASKSYGVAVAKLAGLPEAVLSRARALLDSFESPPQGANGPRATHPAGPRDQMDLFGKSGSMDAVTEEVMGVLRELEPDRLTGIEALQLLHQWKERLSKGRKS